MPRLECGGGVIPHSLPPLCSAAHRFPCSDLTIGSVDALGNTRFKDFEHIDMCNAVLFFLTQGFLRSGPCIRELMRAYLLDIATITVLETDTMRGGLTQAEVTEWITAVKEDGTTWLTEAKHRAGPVPLP